MSKSKHLLNTHLLIVHCCVTKSLKSEYQHLYISTVVQGTCCIDYLQNFHTGRDITADRTSSTPNSFTGFQIFTHASSTLPLCVRIYTHTYRRIIYDLPSLGYMMICFIDHSLLYGSSYRRKLMSSYPYIL